MAEKVTDVVSGKIETTVTEQTTSEKEKFVSQTEQMKKKPLITTEDGSPDKPGGLSIQLCKSEKKEFYIRYSS